MKKRLSFSLSSLRSRPIIVVGLMMVPLLILGTGAIISHRSATNALAETTIEISREIEPVSNLQLALEKAAMPPNDYIITGNAEERAKFTRLSRQTDAAFKAVLRSPFSRREQHLTLAAQRQWRTVKQRSLAVMEIPRPQGNPAAAQNMQRLDAQMERAVALLDRVHAESRKEIIARMAQVDRQKRQAFYIVIVIFAASAAMAASIGTMMARSVIRPLKTLTDGAARFAAGDLGYRAPKLTLNELDQFGRTFNVMAERLTANLGELRAGEAKFRAIADTAVDAIVTIDTLGKIRFVNTAIEQMLGYAPDELIGQNVAVLLPERFGDLIPSNIAGYLATGEKHLLGKTTELAAVKKDGSEFPVELSAAEWKADGHQFFTGIIRDITERKAAERLLKHLSITDSLTGLYNHAEFYRLLAEELERCRRYGSHASLLMLDIDRFKQVNDTFGHQTGDTVLHVLADIINATLRPVDKAARYGGEEFMIILPETDSGGALAAAERLRRSISEKEIKIGKDRTVRISVSIGVTAFTSSAKSADALVGKVDRAMYAAKAAGRNRVSDAA